MADIIASNFTSESQIRVLRMPASILRFWGYNAKFFREWCADLGFAAYAPNDYTEQSSLIADASTIFRPSTTMMQHVEIRRALDGELVA